MNGDYQRSSAVLVPYVSFFQSSVMRLDAHSLFYRVKHLVDCVAGVVSVFAYVTAKGLTFLS